MNDAQQDLRGLHPFDQLLALEALTLRHDSGDARGKGTGAIWAGLGFRIGEWRLLVRLAQVTEVSAVPPITRVPGARPWMRGIANLRGTVLSVADLGAYLGLRQGSDGAHARVLVFEGENWFSGILVDEVLGMRSFYEGDHAGDVDHVDTELEAYLSDAYKSEGFLWRVFEPSRLLADNRFLAAAV
jgi:twitching motility protein PilI